MKRFSNILFVADDELEASAGLDRALKLAHHNDASLTVVDVVEAIPKGMQMGITAITPEELAEVAVSDRREELQTAVNAARERGHDIEVKILVGSIFLEIIRQVIRNQHDLVIKCAETSATLTESLFGSTDMHLLRKCPCPVWLIKSSNRDHFKRVLAALDWDDGDPNKIELNNTILEIATSLAMSESEELHIAHAWEFIGEDIFRSQRTNATAAEVDAMILEEEKRRRHWLETLIEGPGASYKKAIDYLKPELHCPKGTARQAIPTIIKELDVELVVMGTIGRTGIPGFFMGNTAESILNQIDCSVLALNPPGFESPVTLDRGSPI